MSYSKSYEPEGYAQQIQHAEATATHPIMSGGGQQHTGAYPGNNGNIPVMVQPHGAYGASAQQTSSGMPPQPGMDPYGPRQRRQPPPLGKWADGICDWPSNVYPSMYCTCCVCGGAWLLGQISEKVGCCKFKYTIGIYALLCIIGFIIALAIGGNGAIMFWLPQIYVFVHIILVRMYIVKHHQIQECSTTPGCAQFGECCWAFWCNSCSLCQMARYVYGYDQVFDGDGDPYRGDNWAV